MSTCPRDNSCSSQPPPGFSDSNAALVNVQITELLQQLINKFQNDSDSVDKLSKETNLLTVIAQLALLPKTVSPDVKQNFLNKIVTIAQDLLVNERQMNNNDEVSRTIDSNSMLTDNKDVATSITILSSIATNNDGEDEFSLDDLASEYLHNEPSPVSLTENTTTPSESSESDLTLDSLSKEFLSSSPTTSILSSIAMPLSSNESILVKSPLESILFSNRLSSHDAADDADGIWKDKSSPFGKMFCEKLIESPTKVTKRISTCLFDRALYERLTHIIALLPKQCVSNSVQQLSVRRSGQPQQPYSRQQNRPMRPNNDHSRYQHRPTFQQNASQAYSAQHHPAASNSRQYANLNYSNQTGNPGGYFVDRRQPQQQPHQHQHQQSNNRFTGPTASSQQGGDYYQQNTRGPKNNSSGNSGKQSYPNRSQKNNHRPSNDYNHPRDPRKTSGSSSSK